LADLVQYLINRRHINAFGSVRERGRQSWEKVVSLCPAGNATVYDIEVPDHNRYIANSFIVHNCGKSRSLDVIGRLSYKPMMLSGAVTPAPIYRLIRRFRGTLILEEADFRESSEKSEVITILNCGFERNRPIIRCSLDNPDNLEILPCFGPKVFATRFRFNDVALEARCLTFTMEETDREDIPPLLGDDFIRRAEVLRNKLLLWRLHHLNLINPGAVEGIDLGRLEPRLKQLGLPFSIPFKDYPDVMERFKEFMQEYGQEIKRERADSTQGKVVVTLFKLALQERDTITAELISNTLMEDFKLEVPNQRVGKILKSFDVKREKKRLGGQQGRYITWESRLMRKLLRRYILDPEDYSDLFQEEMPDMQV